MLQWALSYEQTEGLSTQLVWNQNYQLVDENVLTRSTIGSTTDLKCAGSVSNRFIMTAL